MGKIWLLGITVFLFTTFKPAFDLHNSPQDFSIVMEDIPHFWKAYDMAKPEFNPEIFQEYYLLEASDGLQLFEPAHIESAERLARTVEANKEYYEFIRPVTKNLDQHSKKIRKYASKLEKMYPESSFPDIYFLMGRKTAAISVQNENMLIGIERFGPDKADSPFANEVWAPVDQLPVYVTRELVHYQQRYPTVGHLLSQSIQQGAADFITELVTGTNPNRDYYKLSDEEAYRYWEVFEVQMLEEEMYSWLNDEDRDPVNLSRIMGYQIVEDYYKQADDKEAALHDILNITDFERFIDMSGYIDRFEE